MRKVTESKEAPLVNVQVPMPGKLVALAKDRAAELGLPLATWARTVLIRELAVPLLDAFAAERPPTPAEVTTWEGNVSPHYKLEAVATPAYDHMTVRVRENRGGGRGFTDPLSTRGLLASTMLGHSDQNRRVIYLRGGTFWKVHTMVDYHGAALVTLTLIGQRHPDEEEGARHGKA
jgi:hypothetical protein